MGAFTASIRKEQLALGRDVHGLAVLFAMPAVFILIMSIALRDGMSGRMPEHLRWAVFDGDGGGAVGATVDRIGSTPVATKTRADGPPQEVFARDGVTLGLVFEEGFSEAFENLEGRNPEVLLYVDPTVPRSVLNGFVAELRRAVAIGRIRSLLTPRQEVAEGNEGMPEAEQLAGVEVTIETLGARERAMPLTSVQQSVPAWLVFSMFFVVIPISNVFIAERQQGTLPRLRSLRVPMLAVLGGKVAAFYGINLVQTGLMLAVGRFVVPWFGVDALRLDCDWLALGVMASAVSLAGIGFALAVSTLARTTEQATTLGGVANILFGAMGGVMVPKLVMPAALQAATVVSPMAWGLEGFLAVLVGGAGVVDVLRPAGALLAMGAVGFAVAWWRLRSG